MSSRSESEISSISSEPVAVVFLLFTTGIDEGIEAETCFDLFRCPNLGSWGFPLESTELELVIEDFLEEEVSRIPPASEPRLLELCSGIILEEFEVKPGDFKEGGGDFKHVDTDKLE